MLAHAFFNGSIRGDSTVAITSSSYVVGIFILLISVVAFIGLFIGHILANKVKVRHVVIGSIIYWTVYFINLYLTFHYHREFIYPIPAIRTLNELVFWSGFLASSFNLAYVIRKYTLRTHSFKMTNSTGEKQK